MRIWDERKSKKKKKAYPRFQTERTHPPHHPTTGQKKKKP